MDTSSNGNRPFQEVEREVVIEDWKTVLQLAVLKGRSKAVIHHAPPDNGTAKQFRRSTQKLLRSLGYTLDGARFIVEQAKRDKE